MTDIRQAVIAEALSWERTPYHHMGRLKGVGVDCAQLPYLVYHSLGLIPKINLDYYSPDWFLHGDVEEYLPQVAALADEIMNPVPGDFALYKIAKMWAHGAIITAPWPNEIVHADKEAGVVIRARGDGGRLHNRKVRFFSLKGMAV